jgi:hypothetical protein
MRSYSLNSALQQITLVLDYVGADAVSTGGAAALQTYTSNKWKGGNINLSVDSRRKSILWMGNMENDNDGCKRLT